MKDETRHKLIFGALRPLVKAFLGAKFGYRFKLERELPDSYLVISNHNTDYDPLFVGSSLKKQMYFVASEHIWRWKRASKPLMWGFAPIARAKGSLASSTVMDVIRKLREGRRVCLFAEGTRSWDGVTGPILPATGKMVKTARCALVTFRIKGGYFTSPMWSGKNLRRGRITGEIVNVYSAEALAKMSAAEVNEAISRDIYEDAYATQAESPSAYRGKLLAEKLENLLFLCPECGEVDSLVSNGDKVSCKACSHSFTYDEFGMLHGTKSATLKGLSDSQKTWLKAAVKTEGFSFEADDAKLVRVEKHEETVAARGTLTMNAERLSVGGLVFPLDTISGLAMHGARAIVFTSDEGYYDLTVGDGSNVYKYMLLYQALKKEQQR